MKESVYIRLAAPDARASWCLHMPQTGFGRVQQATLAELLPTCADRRVVVLLPATDVILDQVEVPERLAAAQPAKIQQAVPFLLEDRLADDVETLHFGIGRRLAGSRFPVAIISRSRMEEWLAPFRAHGIQPSLMTSETLCVPLPHETTPVWSILVEGLRATARTGEYSGFSCELDLLTEFITLAERPADLRLQVYPAGPDEGKLPDLSSFGMRATSQARVADGLEHLLAGLDETGAVNLLQGAYAVQQDFQRILHPWRTPAAMLGVWLTLGVFAQTLEYGRLRHDLAELKQSAETAFGAAFPQVSRSGDIRLQAEQQLALQAKGGNGGFLQLMQATSAALAQISNVQLQEAQFDSGALDVALQADDIQALDTLQQAFAAQSGINLEVQSANAGSQGAQIRLRVRSAPR